MTIVSTIAYYVFAISSGLIVYNVAVYPILAAVLGRLFGRKVQSKPITPRVSLIIAAYNEEDSIRDKMENALAHDYPRDQLEIVVASDGSSDATDEIVESYADRGIRLVRTGGRVGKSVAMNQAVAASDGEILVFSDATTDFSHDALQLMVSDFADSAVGGVCGRIVFRYDDSVNSQGMKFYQRIIVWLRRNESRLGYQLHLTGAIHALRRECFEPCPPDISPELWHVLTIARQRKRSVYNGEAVGLEYTRSAAPAEYRARARACLQSLTFLKYVYAAGLSRISPLYLFQLFSHKALCWLLPLLLLLSVTSAAVLSIHIPIYRWVVGGFLVLAFMALIGWAAPSLGRRIPGLAGLSFFSVFLVAAATAIVKVLRGQRLHTWQTEREEPAPDLQS